MKKLLLLFAGFGLVHYACAQQSIAEDTKGESSLLLAQGGSLRLNVTDANIRASFSSDNFINAKTWFYRFDLSGKNNDGALALFHQRVSPGAKFEASGGYHGTERWFVANLAYEAAKLRLIDMSLPFSEQVQAKSFDGFSARLAFNQKYKGYLLWGFSAGFRQTNNYAALDDIEFTETFTSVDTASHTTRTTEQKVAGKTGAYASFTEAYFEGDAFFLIGKKKNAAIHLYDRLGCSDGRSPRHYGGIGLHLVADDNPLVSKLGLIMQVDDWSKVQDGLGKTLSISLVTQFPIKFSN